eukprot:TRINITY_DN2699_c0_g1_i1.p1 TRINITY_DN2699_c0_g1~~TRINITY_DN2699_c0_g1_i1.p1  ORF type:complete len:351 (+),score=30.53 TRINITY_DN2699_c0_g1_i1:51-1103(+)
MGWRPSKMLVWILTISMCSMITLGSIFVWPNLGSHQERLERHGVVDYLQKGGKTTSSKPEKKDDRKMKKWNGLDIPEEGEWDFHGLPVGAKLAQYDSKAIKADYDITKIDGDKLPPGYEYGENPAFKYPDREDRLFITVSTKPRIIFFPKFATDAEVEAVVRECEPKLLRSQVALTLKHKAGESSTQEVRTSKSTWLNLDGANFGNLNKRTQTMLQTTWHEPMNVLHYGQDQHYDSHHDYFDPNMYGKQSSNRMATFFIYLNDTEAGGATTIPRANGGRNPPNYKESACQQGLQVHPRKGSAFLLYDMRPDRSLDPYSLHGGCDVKKGTKWGGVIWFRTNILEGTGKSHE